VYELDEVSDCAHDEETEAYSLADLDEFTFVGFCAAIKELGAVADEVARDISEILYCVRHFGGRVAGEGIVRGRGLWLLWSVPSEIAFKEPMGQSDRVAERRSIQANGWSRCFEASGWLGGV